MTDQNTPQQEALREEDAATSTFENPKKPRVLVIVGLALVALVAVGALVGWAVWNNYVTSPGYSLQQLSLAVQAKNWDGVQKYVDVDALIGQLVDTALSSSIESDSSGERASAATLGQVMKPGLVQEVKEQWRKGVESGSGSKASADSTNTGSVLNAKTVKSVTHIGDEALVTVGVPNSDGTEFDLKLKMRRIDGFWRVVSIENASDLLQTK